MYDYIIRHVKVFILLRLKAPTQRHSTKVVRGEKKIENKASNCNLPQSQTSPAGATAEFS